MRLWQTGERDRHGGRKLEGGGRARVAGTTPTNNANESVVMIVVDASKVKPASFFPSFSFLSEFPRLLGCVGRRVADR
jgi:hypothetical protein